MERVHFTGCCNEWEVARLYSTPFGFCFFFYTTFKIHNLPVFQPATESSGAQLYILETSSQYHFLNFRLETSISQSHVIVNLIRPSPRHELRNTLSPGPKPKATLSAHEAFLTPPANINSICTQKNPSKRHPKPKHTTRRAIQPQTAIDRHVLSTTTPSTRPTRYLYGS